MPAEDRTGVTRALPFAVILVAAFFATLPLILSGPSCGHDLTFHLLNWMDAAHQWSHGTLRPWWCSAAAWNTGEARFLFYPPISWVLGALLTLILGVTHAPLAYTFLALTASGITMRRFLAAYVSPPLALLGACLYLAHPYMLFTATERTAYAELLAAAWLPWLLHEALRTGIESGTLGTNQAAVTLRHAEDSVMATGAGQIHRLAAWRNPHVEASPPPAHLGISASRLAIPVALLWLTNTPSAVLSTYTLAVVLAVRILLAAREHRPIIKPLLLPATLGYLWGIAISAIYLLPALVQHSAVEVDQAFTSGMRPEDSTLFTHTGEPFHDHVVHQASWLAVILLTSAAVAAAIRFAQRHQTRRLHGMREATLHRTHAAHLATLDPLLLTLTALTAFLLTPASLPLWHHLPELRFLQFPWRALMLQGIVTVTLIVLAVRTSLRTRWAALIALTAVAALSFAAHGSYAQFCDNEDAPTSVLAQYTSGAGFEPYDEYTPKDADNDLLHPGEPPAWTATEATAPPSASTATHAHIVRSTSPDTFIVKVEPTPNDRFVIVRQRSFRNWHATLDGTPVPRSSDRDDDLLAIPLPNANAHTITLHYQWSTDEVAGLSLSILATLAVASAFRPHKRSPDVIPS